jgi:hypothetical protein
MRHVTRLAAVAVLGLGMAFWALNGRAQQEGVATKAGEKLDEVGRAIKDDILRAEDSVRESLSKTSETLREGYAHTRAAVHQMGLIPRVYGRLHWDRELQMCHFVLKADGGTVTVRGIVPDDSARNKAIMLIKDTVGVRGVIDQLGVVSASEAASAAQAPTRR